MKTYLTAGLFAAIAIACNERPNAPILPPEVQKPNQPELVLKGQLSTTNEIGLVEFKSDVHVALVEAHNGKQVLERARMDWEFRRSASAQLRNIAENRVIEAQRLVRASPSPAFKIGIDQSKQSSRASEATIALDEAFTYAGSVVATNHVAPLGKFVFTGGLVELRSSKTDAKGNFSFSIVKDKEYMIAAHFAGPVVFKKNSLEEKTKGEYRLEEVNGRFFTVRGPIPTKDNYWLVPVGGQTEVNLTDRNRLEK